MRFAGNFRISILCFIILWIGQSCQPASNTCKTLPRDGVASFVVGIDTYRVDYWNPVDSSLGRYYTGDGAIASSETLQRILRWLSVAPESELSRIVLFTNKLNKYGEKYELNDVLGCQIFYKSRDVLMHKFYCRNSERLLIERSWTLQSNGASFNNRYDFYKIYFADRHPTVFTFSLVDTSVRFHKQEHSELSIALRNKSD